MMKKSLRMGFPLVLALTGMILEACEPSPPELVAVGRCHYVNPFSSNPECKLYTGLAWTDGSASADCLAGPFGTPGDWLKDSPCDIDPSLGLCVVTPDDGLDYTLTLGGDDARQCSAGAMACTAFAGGTFEASNNCVGYDTAPMSGEASESTVFQYKLRSCA